MPVSKTGGPVSGPVGSNPTSSADDFLPATQPASSNGWADFTSCDMGRLYTAIMPDGSERFAAHLGMGRAALFYDIASLLERYVDLPSGIAAENGEDEYLIDPTLFIAFFDRLWSDGWILEMDAGYLSGWAAHAAGMIENITLQTRRWVDRNGVELSIKRYLRPDESSASTQ